MRMTVLALMLVGCDLGDGPGDDVSDSSMEWVEVCGNGIDDDSDGLTDCEDEACDGDCPEDCEDARDNDGDGLTDCDDEDCSEWCVVDEDGDGFEPLAMGGLDCDDGDPDVHPNAVEVCDEGVDNDCNGVADDEDPDVDPETMTRWYRDLDDDGYGLAEVFEDGCAEPPLSSANDTDCRDFDPDVNPGATEVCNEIDDDCDDFVD